MASSIARVSSEALAELKIDLTSLSKVLLDIHEEMNADMHQVNAAWQDGKYQEFVQNYKPQIDKCEVIAKRYADWCAKVLDPTIENVVAVERTDVGVGEGSVGGWSSAVAGGGMAATAGVTRAGVGFNMGANRGSNSTTKMGNSSVNEYKAKFKEKGIFSIDENGDIKTDRDKLNDAINEVHGNNPKITPEKLGKGHYGQYVSEDDKIIINEELSDEEYVKTLAHEEQHIDQFEFCDINENSEDAICKNLNVGNYKTPCTPEEKRAHVHDPAFCDDKYDKYRWQPAERNAWDEEPVAFRAFKATKEEFMRDHKLTKPRRFKM